MNTDTNISVAIARSRRIRQAQRTRRRRLAFAACACALAGFPLSLSLFGVSSGDVVHAAAAGAESLSDLLNQRSPGERTAAQLTKTKHARALAKRAAKPATPQLAVAPPDFDNIASLLQSPPPIEIAPSFAEIAATFPQSGIIPVPGVGGGGGGGGGGVTPPGGGGGIVTVPTSEPHSPIPVTPLPEPGTWATMLLGFTLLGWRVRRRTRTDAKTAAA